MTLSQPQRLGIIIILALVMAGTRINHFSALPDASWAVFFVAGFYLRGSLRWAFPALMVLAVAIDFMVISSQGMSFWSHYCMSAAYWFLIAAYAAMWFGGSLLRSRMQGHGLRTLGLLVVSFVVAVSVCFVISNGSFYWLSESVTSPSLSGWLQNMTDWYIPYLRTSTMYLCVAVATHVIVARWLRLSSEQSGVQSQRG